MVNFKTQSMTVNGKILIDHGKESNGYHISKEPVSWQQIEYLYRNYKNSVPDTAKESGIFKAKSENELTMKEIVWNDPRSDAEILLEKTILEGILNGTLVYPEPDKWFWQSAKEPALVVPRWIFTGKQCRTITVKYLSAIPELWNRNIAARRIRKVLNPRNPVADPADLSSFRTCLTLIKEDIAGSVSKQDRTFSDELLAKTVEQYMKNLPKKYAEYKAEIGQCAAVVKKAKTPLQKTKAIGKLLDECPMYSCKWNNQEMRTAYSEFINRKTLLFITEFIPGMQMPNIEISSEQLDNYIKENMMQIKNYVENH